MTWREKSVTVDADSEFVFKSVLGDVRIDTSGIERMERKRPDDWDKIKSTMDSSEVLEGFLPWDDVVEISTKEEHLSFPHIDIYVEDESKRDGRRRTMLFFKDTKAESYDQVEKCFKTIRKMWNAHRQRNKLHSLNYSYQDNTHRLVPGAENDDTVEDIEEEGEDEQDSRSGETDHKENDKDDDDGSAGDIIDSALNAPGELMDRFGS